MGVGGAQRRKYKERNNSGEMMGDNAKTNEEWEDGD